MAFLENSQTEWRIIDTTFLVRWTDGMIYFMNVNIRIASIVSQFKIFRCDMFRLHHEIIWTNYRSGERICFWELIHLSNAILQRHTNGADEMIPV